MILIYWLIFIAFLLFIILPSGRIIFALINLTAASLFSKIVICIFLGLMLITLEGYIAGFLGLYKYLQIFLFLQAFVIWGVIFKTKGFLSILKLRISKINVLIFITVGLSLLINSIITFPYGTVTNTGISLPGAHGFDSTWHLALINNLKYSVPPQNPAFSGLSLTGYHYFVDLQFAIIHLLTKIPVPELFFQIIGPFYIILYSALAYLLVKELTSNTWAGFFGVLFTSLSSNWYYMANILYPLSYNWPSVLWIDYFSSKSVNYPLLFSMILFFAVCYLLLIIQKFNLKSILLISIILGSLFAIKSHTALVMFAAIGTLGLFMLLLGNFTILKIFIFSLPIGAVFLVPTVSLGQKTLIFSPFWFIRVMYEASDRLNFPEWELKRQYLLSIGGYRGILKLYLEGILLFLIINLGPFLSGLFSAFLKIDFLKKVVILLLILSALWAFVLTMSFIYVGGAIVTIQFFYPAVVSLGVLTAVVLGFLYLRKPLLSITLGLLIWLSLLPGVIFTLNVYNPIKIYNPVNSFTIDNELVEAAGFLSSQKRGILLASPDFTVSVFLSAYSNQQLFYGSDALLDGLLVDYTDRKQQVKAFFRCELNDNNKAFLKENMIAYVVAKTSDCLNKSSNLEVIFKSNNIVIYKVQNL
ncbi:MAG: hypothetical protein AAB414_02615 [Patescibacteria group bacterium]